MLNDSKNLSASVLIISGESLDDSSVRYRCFHHQEQLKLEGIDSKVAWIGDESLHLDKDIIILHRVVYDDYAAELIAKARSLRKVLVYDADDLVFEPDLARHQAYKFALEDHPIRMVLKRASEYLKALEACDCLITSTEFIAAMAMRRGKKAFVVRNAYSTEELAIASQAYRHSPCSGGRVVLGYMSGTPSHDWDFAEINEALVDVMTHHKNVFLQITGSLNLSPAFQSFDHRVRRIHQVPWQEIYGIIASLDINLVPLELREPFCQGKSEIKYMEAAMVGVPTIASATDSFKHAISSGVNGLLANSTQDWKDILERLIDDPDTIEAIGANAKAHVVENYSPSVRALQLKAVLNEILETFGDQQRECGASEGSLRSNDLVYRKDFGIPFWQRPPLFPPSMRAAYFWIRLSRRVMKYEGWSGVVRRTILHVWVVLRAKIVKLIDPI